MPGRRFGRCSRTAGSRRTCSDSVGDEEVRALASEYSTFALRVNDAAAAAFHTAPATIKKSDLFAAIEDATHVLVVLPQKPQATTTRSIAAEAATRGVTVEFFEITVLQYNVMRHKYVPRHERVPPEEVPALLRTYFLKSKFHLPVILETDPVARYLAMRPGDVVRITRPSANAGVAVFYRVCKA